MAAWVSRWGRVPKRWRATALRRRWRVRPAPDHREAPCSAPVSGAEAVARCGRFKNERRVMKAAVRFGMTLANDGGFKILSQRPGTAADRILKTPLIPLELFAKEARVLGDKVPIRHAGNVIAHGSMHAVPANALAGLLADDLGMLHIMAKQIAQ